MHHTLIKQIRTVIGLLMIVVATAYVLKGPDAGAGMQWVKQVQILHSQKIYLTSLAMLTAWLMMTLAFGRIYCGCICPVGVLQDLIRALSRQLPAKRRILRPNRYRSPRRLRYIMVAIYVVALCLGTAAALIPFVLNPWPIFSNIVHLASGNPMAERAAWAVAGTTVGIVCGILALVVIVLAGAIYGRDYCNTICPVGIGLGLAMKPFGNRAVVNIEIDPDHCIHCGKCEEACPAHCIDLKRNLVDNDRCVRCFDCLPQCPEDAIKYTMRRPRLSNTQTV